MRGNMISYIILCLFLLPFASGIIEPRPLDYTYNSEPEETGSAMSAGILSGKGDAKPLEEMQVSSTNQYSSEFWDINPHVDWTQYQTLIFIVSTEPDGEYIGMTTTAIMCYPELQDDGTYIWKGTNKRWTDYNTLHYKVIATGDQNGFTTLAATAYIWGEETNNLVYIREIIGV